MEFQEIPLKEISPNPHNPRKNYAGKKFDELVESIRKKGVIEPIIVRPQNGKYEIVAGERRYRAAAQIAGENGATVPAVIRELSDDEAFDFMTIENLQREDLTGIEEAESFKVYLEKKGEGALQDLAQRTGIRPTYIRRRIAVLNLPGYVLKAWEKGELVFGQLEQLMRLKNRKQIKEIFDGRKNAWWGRSIAELKHYINNKAPDLKKAKFDLEKSGCLQCGQNTDVQKKLWDLDEGKKTHCLDPNCFKRLQHNYLNANWKKSTHFKYFKTTGFRFNDDVSWADYEEFYSSAGPAAKCKSCEYFLTILNLDGTASSERTCFGDKKCHAGVTSRKQIKSSSGQEENEGPRVRWHGEYFRERFFQVRIPDVFSEASAHELTAAQLTLFALVKSDSDLSVWLAKKTGAVSEKDASRDYFWYGANKHFVPISKLDLIQTQKLIKEAVQFMIMNSDFGAAGRRLVADYIGIDLSKEWAVNKEYLKKKTIKEILAFGEKSGVFEDPKAKEYLAGKLKKNTLKSCKKGDLVKLFLKSGVDLVGKVPDEILSE